MSESSDPASPADDARSDFGAFDEFRRRLVVVRRSGNDRPREDWSHEQHEIARVLGQALGYPAAADGTICTGEHSALSLVTEAAGRIGVLTAEVERLKSAIRKHRDQRGDNRCCIDDIELYRVIADDPGHVVDLDLPPKCDFLQSCARYWEQRRLRGRGPDPGPNEMTLAQLQAEVERLRAENVALAGEWLWQPEMTPEMVALLDRAIEEYRGKAGTSRAVPIRLATTEAAEVRIEVARLRDEVENLRNRPELPRVCVAAVVQQRSGEFLLLKRGAGCTWPGTWCLPGGRLEPNETIRRCLDRELWEEIGLRFNAYLFVCVTEVIDDHGHLIGLVYEALTSDPAPHPVNREPDKHADMRWFSWGSFPEDLMPGTRQWIEKFHSGPICADDN